MAKTYNRLDIEVNKDVTDMITAVQNDTLSRYLDVSLFSNGTPIDLTGHTVRIYMIKPDKTEIFNAGEITDATNGRVQFELTTQALAVCGDLKTQIIVFDNQEKEILSTNIFNILVSKSLKNENSIESSNEYGALVVLFQNIYEALQLLTDVNQKLGLPTDKLEELNLTTMYEVLNYLIDTLEKNSTVAVQGKLDELIGTNTNAFLTGEVHSDDSLFDASLVEKINALLLLNNAFTYVSSENVILSKTEEIVQGTSLTTFILSFIPRTSGTVKVSIDLKMSSTSYTGALCYSLDSEGTTLTTLSTSTNTSYTTCSATMSVTKGVPIYFFMKSTRSRTASGKNFYIKGDIVPNF